MKKHGFRSFRRQLNAAFLAVSLIPLLLCSVLLVQIFRLRISADTQQAAQQQLSAASAALENVHTHLEQTAEALREDPAHPLISIFPTWIVSYSTPFSSKTCSISWIAIVVLPSVLGLPFKINTFNFSAISPSPFHFISLCFSAYTFYYIFYYISYSISILFSGCIFLFLLI